ncbi:HAMP domain-containing protein [Rhodocaloribacter litoris]|uniref:sensor histidine kinase n=1 Tax=Rhodocaloribacter litoris TaxID=2558931 RepID=UPI0014248D06|nr:ATP-binding protein [Rhodocaloribacter litoris]QXD14327.1 HAMP domain-containing protein [Rhodocaloribacter litoris]
MLAGLNLRISTRLTLWYGVTMLILLSLFAFFCYLYFHNSLHRDFDRHLDHEKRELLPFLRLDGELPAFAALDELRSVAYETDGIYGTYVRLLDPAGEVLYQSPNFEGHSPLPVQLPARREADPLSRVWAGRPARSCYTPLFGDDGRLKGWLEVTGFEWSLHQELYRLRLAMLIGIVLSVLLAIGGGYLLARRALRPVAALTEAANEIRATDLSARLPTSFGVRDELTDLAETFNQMIERLQASFDRERRFTDNAAHELLTPLTTTHNSIEITLRRSREPAAYEETLRRLLLDVEEMTETVQGLLQLARIDRLQELPREPVVLSDVVREHVRRFTARAEGAGLCLYQRITPGLTVRAEKHRLGEVVDNLLDNAIKYTPAGGEITVTLDARDEEVLLAVEDTGIGFEAGQEPHLFDRFYRADIPEVQARHGSGLGLSIVRAIVTLYGGTVTAWSAGPGRGSRFEVRLPRHLDAASRGRRASAAG